MKKALEENLLKGTIEAQKKRIARMKSRKDKYKVLAGGKELIVLPKVFYPGRDSILMIETVKFSKRDIVLDSCSGTGIFAVFAAGKAEKVYAVDANKYAAENIRINAVLHGVEDKIVPVCGDLFPKLGIKFDKILVNPPYTDNKAADIVEKSVWDEDHKVVKKFFKEVKNHLKETGKIFLSWSNFADFDFIEDLAKKSGFEIRQLSEAPEAERNYRIYKLSQK